MVKPLRSPVLGYNHNIRHLGRVFHVQTEDSGPIKARLFTHLFFAGTILASKKHEYDGQSPEDAVRALMQRLHKAMIKELSHGEHDGRIGAFFMTRGETAAVEEPGPAAPSFAVAPPMTAPPAAPRAPAVVTVTAATPRPLVPMPARPQMTPKPVVMVKPGDVRRPPVVLSSSADGVVVQRNVVINVGGGAPPVNGTPGRAGRAPHQPVPYVVRDGSYPGPTATRGSGVPIAVAETHTQPLVTGRDPRLVDVALRVRAPVASERTPAERALAAGVALRARAPAAPSERTPPERSFAPELATDKSLDEVILEYLSDDADPEPR